MALAYDKQFATANNKTANSTTIQATASATINVGQWVIIAIAKDNTGGGAEETEMSVADSVGNTYTRVRERSTGNPAQGGSHVGLFYAPVTNQIVSGSTTITVTLGGTAANNDAQCFVGHAFTIGAGATLALQSASSNYWPDSADPTTIALSGLTSRDYCYVYAGSYEGVAGDGWAHDGTLTSLTGVSTSGGGAASNQTVTAAYKLASASTGSGTLDPSLTTDRDGAHIIAAFYEIPASIPGKAYVAFSRAAVRRAAFY